MGRDEHFDEIVLFDSFFLSVIIYLLAGRIGYVTWHHETVGTLYRSLAVFAYPGINVVTGLVATLVFMFFFARANNWNFSKVADAFVVALSLALTFGSIGAILNGSNPVWQVNLIASVWAFVTFIVVSRVRKNFRFYSWYKGESSIAQEGLAALMFMLSVGVYCAVISFVDQLNWKIWIIPGELMIGLFVIIASIYMISRRTGRRESTLWGKLGNIIRRK